MSDSGRALQPLDRGVGVASRLAGIVGGGREVGGDAPGGEEVARPVRPAAAAQAIPPKSAVQCVVARAPVQEIRIVAAIEEVVPAIALEPVRPADAEEAVVSAVATQDVRETRAVEAFDRRIGVAARLAGVVGRSLQIDGQPGGQFPVNGAVETLAAHQPVRAEPAQEKIVPVAAIEPIVEADAELAEQRVFPVPAEQRRRGSAGPHHVVELRPDHLLDRHISVARGVAAIVAQVAEIDRHCRLRRRVAGRVYAGSAVETVAPSAADQLVVATQSEQTVAGRSADQPVISGRSIDCRHDRPPPMQTRPTSIGPAVELAFCLPDTAWVSNYAAAIA